MANITSNEVTITGCKNCRKEFLQLFEPYDDCFTFQAFKPMPESLNITSGSEMRYAMYFALVVAGGEEGKPPLDMLKLVDPENELELRSRNGRHAKDCKEKLAKLWEDIKNRVEPYPDDGSVDLTGDLSEVHLMNSNEQAKTRAQFLKYGQTAIDNLRQYGYTDWYGWCVDNWGCKWDASEGDIEDYGDEIYFSFCTPWGPPEPIFKEMVQRFPKLTFDINVEYDEGYRQRFHGENGILTDEWLDDDWDDEDEE